MRFLFVGGRQASDPRFECVLLGAEERALLLLSLLLLLAEPRLRGLAERVKAVDLRFSLVGELVRGCGKKREGGGRLLFFLMG